MSKKRPCKICGIDLNLYGPDYKGRPCPDCLAALKQTVMPCAGKCGDAYPIAHMKKIIIAWDPGVKGGERTHLYYCRPCLSIASSRASTMERKQKKCVEFEQCKIKREAESFELKAVEY